MNGIKSVFETLFEINVNDQPSASARKSARKIFLWKRFISRDEWQLPPKIVKKMSIMPVLVVCVGGGEKAFSRGKLQSL